LNVQKIRLRVCRRFLNVQNIRLEAVRIVLKVKTALRRYGRTGLKVKTGSRGSVGPQRFAAAQKNTLRGLAGAFI
jgi:hypothetical protein